MFRSFLTVFTIFFILLKINLIEYIDFPPTPSLIHECVYVRVFAALFGIVTYGTHINGYTYNDSGEMLMWIAKREKAKSTYPGMYDNLVRINACLFLH